jgi:peptidyl-prolyl cis-trans isomerase C
MTLLRRLGQWIGGHRRAGGALGLVSLVAVGAVVAGVARSGDGALPEGAVLAVGATTIDQEAFDRRVEVLGALYGVTPPTDAEGLRRFRGEAAKALAFSILIDEDAAGQGVVVAERTVRDALDRYIQQSYPTGGREAFVTALGDRGVSEEDVLDEVGRQLTVRQLFDEVAGDIEISDADVDAYVEEHAAELALPEQRRLRHVVSETEAEAADVARRLAAGEPIAELAAALSLDQSTSTSGGDLGWVARSQLLAEFADAAFEAPAGAVFGPVHTELGWHVGVVEEIVAGRDVARDEVADSVRERLRVEEALSRWRAHLGGLLEGADVRYADEYLPERADEPPSADLPGLDVPTSTTLPGPAGTESGG